MFLEVIAGFIGFLDAIPDVIWSGIIASGLTLGGVLISNRSNTTRLRMQLNHDSLEKSKERITSIRREVYLRSTDEAHKVMRHFVGLPYVDFSKINPSQDLHGFQSVLSKLKLVVEPGTVALVNSLDKECNKLFIKLVIKVQPIQDARAYVSGYDKSIKFFKDKAAELLAEIKIINDGGESNVDRLKGLMKAYEEYMSQAASNKLSRENKQEKVAQLTEEYTKEIFLELTPFAKLLIKIEVEMRGELGLSTDAVAYMAQMDQYRAEAGEMVEETLFSMRSSFRNTTKDEKNG